MESVENVDKKEEIIMVNKEKELKIQKKRGKAGKRQEKGYVN